MCALAAGGVGRERSDQALDEKADQSRGRERRILFRQVTAGDGRGDARRKFRGERFAKSEPRGIELGIDRLGDRRKGQPAVAQRPRGKCHDRGRERRQRTGRDVGGAAQRARSRARRFPRASAATRSVLPGK